MSLRSMLNQTMTVRRKTETVDSTTGAKAVTWYNAYTGLACTIQPNSPREEQVAMRETGIAGAMLYMMPSSDVQNTDQVFIDGGLVAFNQFTGTATVVTITRSGATATVADTAHGLTVGQPVVITGADQTEYNGSVVVVAATTNTWTYTVSGTPATPATGTIYRYAPNVFTVTGYPIDDAARGTYLRCPVEYRVGGGYR